MKSAWLLLAMLCVVGGPVRSGADEEPRNVETTCNRGKHYEAGLCYERCKEDFKGVGPVCWADCPDGYKDDGALCRKDAHIIPKDSYGRGAGTVPPTCATPSFTKPVPPVSDLNAFTMIIASDPQFPWWKDTPPCDDDKCTKRNSKRANSDQVRAMNDIQRASNPLQPGPPGVWPSRPDIQGVERPSRSPGASSSTGT
ncbi:hypothetical protein [Corallococcus exiguus]|uniref:Uncharacterized protein n=1 Tax=Corallococcus exiguus TaxID=83462 RepID=A0A7X4YFE0_9BACT|nr:hypothetical protein [Corallococcus exiguus]NBC44436.1 hypothetical protein [Corallococcus exiguus]TNV62240.1 hypothetical protein FH620_18650 [Corallococcus exiguus]